MTLTSRDRLRCTSIHLLDDDSLLNIFYLYRPALLDEAEDNDTRILQGGEWDRERWWYNVAHVCGRWRYLILGSTSYLRLRLVCTHRTPLVDMLAHSPPLPLIIDLIDQDHDIAAKDDGIMLALRHRDRVCRIRLRMPVPDLQRFIMALDGRFPMLEYLYILPLLNYDMSLVFPKSFQAPYLRHLVLERFTSAMGSPLLTNAMDLVTLSLQFERSFYLGPNNLLQLLSLMPQLETLRIIFYPIIPHLGRPLLDSPSITPITLPSLRWFAFRGASAYLEELLPQMTTPILEKLQIFFLNEPTFSVPPLLELMSTSENLSFSSARFRFDDWCVIIKAYPRVGAKIYTLHVEVP